ncbi:MAG: hypothetical protein JWO05_597 [Gemmatimonadetes bacterium]|nr:hypothetical protein [Gemmatimonadota bacterium]
MIARLLRATRAIAVLALGAGALRAQAPRVQVGVQPETVTVGQPFVVMVRVTSVPGATILFPAAPDSSTPVQSLDPRVVKTDAAAPGAFTQLATYRLAAWDIGDQPIALTGLALQLPGGGKTPLSLGPLEVFVRSVLPRDSTERVPKPPRPPFFGSAIPWWVWALVAAAAAALLGWFIWWWRRRRERGPQVIEDPFLRAERDFDRLEKMGLVPAGERVRHVALAVEILRDYLAARHEAASLALTSRELVQAVKAVPTVPRERLSRLLEEADLAKFARRPLSDERARELGREGRALISAEHAAAFPPEAVPARAAA